MIKLLSQFSIKRHLLIVAPTAHFSSATGGDLSWLNSMKKAKNKKEESLTELLIKETN